MQTRIISAFPGTGKSYYHKDHKETSLDSDSSMFSWVLKDGEKVRNPDFPKNYIDHIKENIGKYEYIFVSSHKEVRDALMDNCLIFYLILPSIGKKEEYLKRYKERGSPQGFIDLIDKNWNDWINECFKIKRGCKRITMLFDSMEDELIRINNTEV